MIVKSDKLVDIIKESIVNNIPDFSKINRSASYSNPLTRLFFDNNKQINEGLIRTYPIEKTIEYIKNYFNLEDGEIREINGENGIKEIVVWIYATKENLEMMKRAMSFCGYHLGFPNENSINDGYYTKLQFEPINQNDVTEKIRNMERTLIHITPLYNLGKIKNIGLSPRSKNMAFNYPDRIYLIKGSMPKQYIKSFSDELSFENKSVANTGEYVALTLDVSKIPDRVRFYYDPNFTFGIFTTDNIPYSSVINVEEIKTRDKDF